MSTLRANQIQTITGKPIVNSTGSILNVAYTEYTTAFANSAEKTYQIFYSLPITATASNSRYLLIGNAHSYNLPIPVAPPGTPLTYGRCNMGYSVTIGGVTTRISGVDGSNGDSWGYPALLSGAAVGCHMNRQAIYTSSASAGTTLTFNFLVASWEGLGQYNWQGTFYNQKSTFTIMEISS
jgi:hypothetical protein